MNSSLILCVIGSNITETTVQTLYSVVGIIFSVLMSLIISISTNAIVHEGKNDIIKNKIKYREYGCIFLFIFITVFFIFYRSINNISINCLEFSSTSIAAFVLIIGIIIYIYMFVGIKNEIDNIILKQK